MSKYTEEELSAMTITAIKELALNIGYVITKTRKDDIIAEFMSQQNSSEVNS